MGERFYRLFHDSEDLIYFNVKLKETDLNIGARINLEKEALDLIKVYRKKIEDHIERHPDFRDSLKPLTMRKGTEPILEDMYRASYRAGVGPMATVAGVMAQYIGKGLLKFSDDIIVENGGDIFIKSSKDRIVGIFAGDSPLNGKLAIKIKAEDTPLGICTSSGKVGHALSFGKAHAGLVISRDTGLADGLATAMSNRVKSASDIEEALDFASKIDGIDGALIIIDDSLGAWGKIELVRL